MNCAAEMRDFSQIIDWKTGVDFGNITPARRLETMTGLAGNFDRREHLSDESDIPYQSLINLYLLDCVKQHRKLRMDWATS